MKIKSFFIAALVIASAMSSVAADVPRTGMVVIPVKGSEVFKVIYKAETAGRVKLNIYNAQLRVILSETFNGVDGFILPVNFKGLQFGEYTIELIDANGSRVEKVNFVAPATDDQVASKGFAHISKMNDGRFLLSVVNASEKVNVRIYDVNETLVHSETKAVSGDFAQVYKLGVTKGFIFRIADANGLIKTIQF
jgi:hypothetical protein